MRLIIASEEGIDVLRWIEGERSAQRLTRALEPESITCLYRASPEEVFCGTESGKVYVSHDRGESWTPRARDPERRAVRTVEGRAGPDATIYVGTEPTSLHVSRDRVITMEELTSLREMGEEEDWEGYGDRRPHVEAVAPDPADGRRLYAGIEVGGVYRTDNDGTTWTDVSSGVNEDVHDLAVDPARTTRVYVATGGGFYVSDDRGRDWSERSPEAAGECYCTAFLPPDRRGSGEGELLLAVATALPGSWGERPEGADARLFRAGEIGEGWTPVPLWTSGGVRPGIAVMARSLLEEGDFFVGLGDGRLHYAVDGGEAWSEVFEGLPKPRALEVV